MSTLHTKPSEISALRKLCFLFPGIGDTCSVILREASTPSIYVPIQHTGWVLYILRTILTENSGMSRSLHIDGITMYLAIGSFYELRSINETLATMCTPL